MMDRPTDPSVFWDKMVRVATVLGDNEVAHILDWLPVNPT
jgi:hypothetical protein